MRFRRRPDPALTFPTHLETTEQTIKRFEREQAAYVRGIMEPLPSNGESRG